MINWNKKTFGQSQKGRQVAPMTAAQYAANPSLIDNSDDSVVGFHLEKKRGKFISPLDVVIERRKRSSKRRSKEHTKHIKMLQRMGFVTSWTSN